MKSASQVFIFGRVCIHKSYGGDQSRGNSAARARITSFVRLQSFRHLSQTCCSNTSWSLFFILNVSRGASVRDFSKQFSKSHIFLFLKLSTKINIFSSETSISCFFPSFSSVSLSRGVFFGIFHWMIVPPDKMILCLA